MKNVIYLNDLYDIYGELLDDNKKEYFKLYYFDNLSLSEISEKKMVSRNAVYKQLKSIEEKLNFFESKLNLYKKRKEFKDILDKIDDKELVEKLNNISW